MATSRVVLHVDMDAFYASVEQHDRPELQGLPVLVGSDRRRGVVAAASYEARAFGCHSAQPMAVALRGCPTAHVVRPRFERYAEVSRAVFQVFAAFAPVVEPLSIDEAFLDLTGTERLFGKAPDVARRIKDRIRDELGITASVGVAPNKFLAKLASDLRKPDGLVVLTPANQDAVLLPLPVERMWGVGPASAARLHEAGIHTFADLRKRSPAELARRFGDAGPHWQRLARGLDERVVHPPGEAKSLSHEHTFEEDVEDPAAVRAVLHSQTEAVARRVRRHGLKARTVAIKIRYGAFETITRSTTLSAPTDVTLELWRAAAQLYERWARTSFRPVRLIGMGASHLDEAERQLTLFPDRARERRRKLDEALDRIRDRFGPDAIGAP